MAARIRRWVTQNREGEDTGMARTVTGSMEAYVGASLMAIAMTLAAPAMAQSTSTPTTPGDQSTTQQTVPIAGETPDAAPQAADADQPDIVVTGFRASLNSALNLKRNETAAVDSIVAEDIGHDYIALSNLINEALLARRVPEPA